MSRRPIFHWFIAAGLCIAGAAFGWQPNAWAQPADYSPDEQVLTSGPVHEAFAETVSYNPQPGIVVAKAPPEPVEELPPDQRPEGANVSWIPGYWAWDDERSDFLWVSGIWRDVPIGRQWVPGYWSQTDASYQWTSGYWADAQAAEVEYLPEPPQSIEAGPSVAAPSDAYTWLPGIWIWRQTRYVWRPGFWAAMQPDWVWTPDHYVWTPGGYVFVGGYWDYALVRRGILFAPIYYSRPIYLRPRFVYSPAIVIGLNGLVDNLFLRPRYCHYYFGDYYAASYERAGFYPWFSYSRRIGYDPFFAHQRWEHRGDRDWAGRLEREFRNRRDHVDLRPPRTFALQQSLLARRPDAKNLVMADRFSQLVARKSGPIRFQPVTKVESQKFVAEARSLQLTRKERKTEEFKRVGTTATRNVTPRPGKTETPPFKPAGPGKSTGKPVERIERESNRREPQFSAGNKGRLPHSPIVARPPAQLDRAHMAPQVHTAPKPNLKIESKPRPKIAAPPRVAPPKGKGPEEKKKN